MRPDTRKTGDRDFAAIRGVFPRGGRGGVSKTMTKDEHLRLRTLRLRMEGARDYMERDLGCVTGLDRHIRRHRLSVLNMIEWWMDELGFRLDPTPQAPELRPGREAIR